MTIIISQSDYWNLFTPKTGYQYDAKDESDWIWNYPLELAEGTCRSIELRSGIELEINDCQFHDNICLKLPEREHVLEYSIFLSGNYLSDDFSFGSGQYALYGSGMAPKEAFETQSSERVISINVHLNPETFLSFLGDSTGQLPCELAHLIRNTDDLYYSSAGTITSAMQVVLQQILHCPYQGTTKRIYLESKVFELMSLLVEADLAERKDKKDTPKLKNDDIERIHYAKKILLQRLDDPPSLMELARIAGLNDCTLKRGFRQCFGTTVFGYLHNYRLEKAQQLLLIGDMSIAEVASCVGFASRSYFATAFRKKFGANPKQYLINWKNSA
ncbi:AraC family transcriptional regulator [Calothrix sp. HK-06]|nr:AraC family transcriptional regulator [Calothrix sp. HK-06]